MAGVTVSYRDDRYIRHEVALTADARIAIGRDHECEVCLHWDSEVSRLHAVLERVGRTWFLVDQQSTNGTFIGGEAVTRRRLQHGDRLRCGGVVIDYSDPRPPAVDATTPSPKTALIAGPTPAQRRVLLELARPMLRDGSAGVAATNQQIAEALIVSVPTVKSHLRNLARLLSLGHHPQNEQRTLLARKAIELRLVDPTMLGSDSD